jgi:hypothetical protein
MVIDEEIILRDDCDRCGSDNDEVLEDAVMSCICVNCGHFFYKFIGK